MTSIARAAEPVPARHAARRITVRCETSPSAQIRAQWDRLVERTPGTDVTQLSAWSVIRSSAGFRPRYVLASNGETVVGGALLQCRRLFGVLPVCYLPYGPVIDEAAKDDRELTGRITAELVRLARRSSMTFVQPPEGAEGIRDRLLANGFRPSHAGIAPVGSYRLDLTQPLEVIRAGFSKRLKSWTNRWQSKGVSVRRGDASDVPLLLALMDRSAARQGFRPSTMQQVEAVYRELAPRGHAAIFIGELDGRPVAADLITMLGETVQGRRCGFDSAGAAGRLSVPAAVRWEIIKWAKAAGYRWLDFGGLPEPMLDDMLDRGVRNSEEWPSAHRSKLSFNGRPFRYPGAVEMIHPRPVRFAYDAANASARGRRLIAGAKTALRVGR